MAKPPEKRTGLYARAYCDYLTDPKLSDLLEERKGLEAWGVHALATSLSRLHKTDGAVSRSMLKTCRGTPTHARLLVASDLWRETGTGWQIAAFTKEQDTAADIEVRVFRGQLDACRRYVQNGKRECTCGHHDTEGDLLGDPVGDLWGFLLGDPVGDPRLKATG